MNINIKTKLMALALGVAMLGSASVMAAIPKTALVLGGIEYGASEAYVKSVYGSPREIEKKQGHDTAGNQVVEYEYGNDFEVTFVNGVVHKVEIGSNNGVATLAGIKVGSSINELLATYGQPDNVWDGDYIYYVDGDKSLGLVFDVEQGLVDDIKMGVLH